MITVQQIVDCQNITELADIHNRIDGLFEDGKITLNEHYDLTKKVMDVYHELELCQFDGDTSWEG